jgi:ubiquinone/menaquinone biosynthesis C-methylase UbiE
VQNTDFVGMDSRPHWSRTEHLRERNELPFMQLRVQFVIGDLLHDLKRFGSESFNHIRLGFLSLSLPKRAWRPLLAEIDRVLAPGGTVEVS